MVVSREKLSDGPMDRSAGVLGVVSGALFLRSSRVHPTLLMTSERLPRMGTGHRKCTSDLRGLAREAYVSRVSGFPL
jgi:hypothetical protein